MHLKEAGALSTPRPAVSLLDLIRPYVPAQVGVRPASGPNYPAPAASWRPGLAAVVVAGGTRPRWRRSCPWRWCKSADHGLSSVLGSGRGSSRCDTPRLGLWIIAQAFEGF